MSDNAVDGAELIARAKQALAHSREHRFITAKIYLDDLDALVQLARAALLTDAGEPPGMSLQLTNEHDIARWRADSHGNRGLVAYFAAGGFVDGMGMHMAIKLESHDYRVLISPR